MKLDLEKKQEVYESPFVRILEIYFEGLICTSGIIDDDKDNEGYFGDDAFEW